MLLPQVNILTTHGFMPIANLGACPVANFDPLTAQLIDYIPAEIQAIPYTGPVFSITGAIDVQFTPNQVIYVSLSATQATRLHPVFERINLNTNRGIEYAPMRWCRGGSGTCLDGWSPPYIGCPIAWARLIGFIIGDGHASSRNGVTFHLKRSRKIDWLHEVCSILNLELRIGRGDRYRIHLDNFGDWCRHNLYQPNGEKQIPEGFLTANQAVIEGLIDGLMTSDGYQDKMFTTTSEQVADMMLALGALSGNLMSLTVQKTCYRLTQIRRLGQPHINDSRGGQTQLNEHTYNGLVYELRTDTGLILVRNGRRTALIGTDAGMIPTK